MQARFLLGPAGSGKTYRCLAEVRAELLANPDGPPLLFLAPKQATFQLERQLLTDVELPRSARPRPPRQSKPHLQLELLDSQESDEASDDTTSSRLHGYSRLHILSFERLARFVFDKLRIAPPRVLSEEGRIMVLRALLMRHAGELKAFKKSSRRPGFARQLCKLLAELEQHRFAATKLAELARRPDLPAELHDKLHDLALLSEANRTWLEERQLQDSDSLLNHATDALRHPDSSLSISALWLDGFAEMTPAEMHLLAAIVPHCDTATLAFCLDPQTVDSQNRLSQWSLVNRTWAECRALISAAPGVTVFDAPVLERGAARTRFDSSPALAHLELNWPQPHRVKPFHLITAPAPDHVSRFTFHAPIQLAACSNPGDEATFAAREILRFVQSGGRFREAAVLVRHFDNYNRPLERAFHRYGIPFFLDRRESVAHHPLAELTRSALRVAVYDWQHEDWFAALKSGFSPASENEIDRLENEALANGWRGRKWREPLKLPPEKSASLEKLESLRQRLVPPFLKLLKTLNPPRTHTGTQLAQTLRDLWSDLSVETRLQEWSEPSLNPSNGDQSAIGNRQSAVHSTVWEQMNAWLENLELAFSDEAMSLRDWLPVLDAGLATLTVGVIPPSLDQVLIGSIDRSRNPELKLALVLGLNEGVFPAAPASPEILTESDRDALSHRGAALGLTLHERLARERYYGYIAFTRASEKVVATCSTLSADGKALNPSPFVAHLHRLFDNLPKATFSGSAEFGAGGLNQVEPSRLEAGAPREADILHASELTKPVLAIQNPQIEVPNWRTLLGLPALTRFASSLARLGNPDPNELLSPALAERLFGPTLHTSVSKLEHFAACPFRFFIHGGLRADERRLLEPDAREQGSFQHDVLAEFHNQLVREGKRWRDLTPAEARSRVGEISARMATAFRDGLFQDNKQSQFLARVLGGALQDFVEIIVTWMRESYRFDPVAVELAFGEGDFPAWTIDLGNGHQLSLRGRIDRVDICQPSEGSDALAVVIDYKSGGKKLDAALIKHGVQLQLLAYLNVLRHSPATEKLFGTEQLTPAGVFYISLRGRYESAGTRTEALADSDVRRQAYNHTGRLNTRWLEHFGPRSKDGESDQFNYRITADDSIHKGSKEALEHDEFIALLDGVAEKLREMGRKIYSGTVNVDPYRKGKATACDYCDCRAICRIDPWTHRFRILQATGNATP